MGWVRSTQISPARLLAVILMACVALRVALTAEAWLAEGRGLLMSL